VKKSRGGAFLEEDEGNTMLYNLSAFRNGKIYFWAVVFGPLRSRLDSFHTANAKVKVKHDSLFERRVGT